MRDKRVAILESRLGTQMVELVAKHGGLPLHAPALAEVPDVDPAYVERLLHDAQTRPAKVAIFQTGIGTRALFATTDVLGLTQSLLDLLAATTVVVRGPKPTTALRARNIRIDLRARDPFTTQEVLEAMQNTPVDGERVIVQRYGVTNVELEDALKARGARFRSALIKGPGGRQVLVDDPSGNPIELFEPRPAAQ